MKRRILIFLTIAFLLLSGCIKLRTNRGPVEIELQGGVAHNYELLLKGEQQVYLLSLDQTGVATLPIKSGTWLVQAFGYDTTGKLLSISDTLKIRANLGGLVALQLQDLNLDESETTRPQNVAHQWDFGQGIELSWDASAGTMGKWEVWKRGRNSLLWQRIAELPKSEIGFTDKELNAPESTYAVCFRTADGFSTTALVESAGPALGLLEVSWNFEHYFAPVSQSQSFPQVGLAAESDLTATYHDLIVHFNTEEDFVRRVEILNDLGLKLLDEIPSLLVAVVAPNENSEISLEEWGGYQDQQLFIEPNWIVQASASALAFNQNNTSWYLDYLRIPLAWQKTQGDQQVRIAVLDSGVNVQELPSSVRVLPGYNFVNKNRDTRDDFAKNNEFHGTKITRTISEAMPVVSILPVKVLDKNGEGTHVDIANGMLFAMGLHDTINNPNPVQIVNMSLGGLASTLHEKVRDMARRSDSLMIAASGNQKWGRPIDQVLEPAAFPEVVAVGAIEPGLSGPRRAYYSHYGQDLDLVAPPSFQDGTSFSTALVSGVAGLMLAGGIPLREIRQVLVDTATDLGFAGWDQEHGYGMVNAWWAVQGASELNLTIKNQLGDSLQVGAPLREDCKKIYLPPGEYTVVGWLNLQGALEPQIGDHFGQSTFVTVGEHGLTNVHFSLTEVVN